MILNLHNYKYINYIYMYVCVYIYMCMCVCTFEGKRRSGGQRIRWLYSITSSMDMNLSKVQEDSGRQRSPAYCSPWDHKESDMTW